MKDERERWWMKSEKKYQKRDNWNSNQTRDQIQNIFVTHQLPIIWSYNKYIWYIENINNWNQPILNSTKNKIDQSILQMNHFSELLISFHPSKNNNKPNQLNSSTITHHNYYKIYIPDNNTLSKLLSSNTDKTSREMEDQMKKWWEVERLFVKVNPSTDRTYMKIITKGNGRSRR